MLSDFGKLHKGIMGYIVGMSNFYTIHKHILIFINIVASLQLVLNAQVTVKL